jgi:hypothetical protein
MHSASWTHTPGCGGGSGIGTQAQTPGVASNCEPRMHVIGRMHGVGSGGDGGIGSGGVGGWMRRAATGARCAGVVVATSGASARAGSIWESGAPSGAPPQPASAYATTSTNERDLAEEGAIMGSSFSEGFSKRDDLARGPVKRRAEKGETFVVSATYASIG